MFDVLFAIILILAVWKICELVYNPDDYNPTPENRRKKTNTNELS
jgi:hypothetical protein